MAKNQKKYTEEFKQQIIDLYATGNYSISQLEGEYGVAKSTISALCAARRTTKSVYWFYSNKRFQKITTT